MVNLEHCVLDKYENNGERNVLTRKSEKHLAPSKDAYLCAMIANNAIYKMMNNKEHKNNG
jgi:hypothetical protein